jgi:hypothetical protein
MSVEEFCQPGDLKKLVNRSVMPKTSAHPLMDSRIAQVCFESLVGEFEPWELKKKTTVMNFEPLEALPKKTFRLFDTEEVDDGMRGQVLYYACELEQNWIVVERRSDSRYPRGVASILGYEGDLTSRPQRLTEYSMPWTTIDDVVSHLCSRPELKLDDREDGGLSRRLNKNRVRNFFFEISIRGNKSLGSRSFVEIDKRYAEKRLAVAPAVVVEPQKTPAQVDIEIPNEAKKALDLLEKRRASNRAYKQRQRAAAVAAGMAKNSTVGRPREHADDKARKAAWARKKRAEAKAAKTVSLTP